MRRLYARYPVEQRHQRPRVTAPQDRDQRRRGPPGQRPDRLLGHLFPALAPVRPGLTRRDGQYPVEQQYAPFGPRGEVPRGGRGVTQVVAVFTEDVDQARRQPFHLGRDREAEADRMPGRGVGGLADDQPPHIAERLLEPPQHVVAGRQVPAPGGHLGSQELSHRRDLARDRLECLRPARVDDVAQRLRHGEQPYRRPRARPRSKSFLPNEPWYHPPATLPVRPATRPGGVSPRGPQRANWV